MEESSTQSLVQRSKAAFYIALYILLSGGQIFFNKWVLSPFHFNFPFPVTLTTCHMLFSTLLCVLIFNVFKIRKLAVSLTWKQYMRSVFPVGAMFAMTLWFGNTAFLYISISFAQMLKACMPVVVLLISAAVGLEELTGRMLGIMSVISGGVLVASVGEISFSWAGVVYQMLGVVGEAGRLILAELLLKKKGMSMDPLSMMYYVSPASAACLLLPWYALEYPDLVRRAQAVAGAEVTVSGTRTLLEWISLALATAAAGRGVASLVVDAVVLCLNALCTFALNLSVFLVLLHTSALTIRVAGVVKDWLVVVISAVLFADTKLTPINVFGYAVAIAGVVMYNNTKMKPPTAAASPLPVDGEENQPLASATGTRAPSPKGRRPRSPSVQL